MLFTQDLGTKRSTSRRSSMSTLWEDHEARHKSTLDVNITPNDPRTTTWRHKTPGLRRKIHRLGRQDPLTIHTDKSLKGHTIYKENTHNCKRSSPVKDGPESSQKDTRPTGLALFCGGSGFPLYQGCFGLLILSMQKFTGIYPQKLDET
jgi:hypothetical protein